MYPDRSPPPDPPAIPPRALRFIRACYALAFVGAGGVFLVGGRRGADFFGVVAAVGIVVGAAAVFVLWCRGVARLALRAVQRSRRAPAGQASGVHEREPANDPYPPAAI